MVSRNIRRGEQNRPLTLKKIRALMIMKTDFFSSLKTDFFSICSFKNPLKNFKLEKVTSMFQRNIRKQCCRKRLLIKCSPYCLKYTKMWAFVLRIFPYMDRISDSVHIRENTDVILFILGTKRIRESLHFSIMLRSDFLTKLLSKFNLYLKTVPDTKRWTLLRKFTIGRLYRVINL